MIHTIEQSSAARIARKSLRQQAAHTEPAAAPPCSLTLGERAKQTLDNGVREIMALLPESQRREFVEEVVDLAKLLCEENDMEFGD